MARADYRPARPVGPGTNPPGQMRWLGAWVGGTEYEIADVVSYDPDGAGPLASGSYVATTAHTANDPAPLTDIGVGDFSVWAVSIGWEQIASVGQAAPLVEPETWTASDTATIGTLVLADTSGGGLTVTLPDAGESAGQCITVKKIAAGYTLTIASADGMRFDSVHTSALVTDLGVSYTFVSDGTYWNVT